MRRIQPADSVKITRGDRIVVHRNTRMRAASLLLAQMLVDLNTPGITHLALGGGVGSGTLTYPQAPNVDRLTMRSEFNRVPVTSVTFDDLTNAQGDTFVSGSRTNRLLVRTEVPLAEASDLITEVALFGGYGADVEDGGTMFAWTTFPSIDNRAGGDDPEAPKDLTFDWVLKFPLVTVEEQA